MDIIAGAVVLSSCFFVGKAQDYCTPSVAPGNCSAGYGDLCSSYNGLLDSYNDCGCGVDPCAASTVDNYNLNLHIGSIFIVFATSLLGAGTPILSKYSSKLSFISPFHVCLGKCMGIGIVLACSLVHMMQPANESLTSPCVPYEFNTDYTAYAFLFAMLAGLAMQFIDYIVYQYMLAMQQAKVGVTDQENQELTTDEKPRFGHTHTIILDPKVHRTITAYLLEFGVTEHSVFVGLTIGVADYDTLRALLVALCFHQFFEGVALGSRIADASLTSKAKEFVMALTFSVSAPLGIGVGIIVISNLNANGESFQLVSGIFDAICSGILLYIGYTLLLKDFPEDMYKHCKGQPHENYKRAAMFMFLWLGAGLMAFIGKYL